MPHRTAQRPTEPGIPLVGGGVSEAMLREAFDQSTLPRLGWTFEDAIGNTAIRISLNNVAEARLRARSTQHSPSRRT